MDKSKKILFSWLAIVSFTLLVAIGLELGSAAYLFSRDRALRSIPEMLSAEENAFQTSFGSAGCTWGDLVQAHPYLAYVYTRQGPCASPGINSLGFAGPDFPEQKDPREHVVLLLGGSVAELYGRSGLLERSLNVEFGSRTGKHFRVLIGAAGAWKNPQQYILFMLTANRVDTVITLDGFNEQFCLFPRSAPIENPPLDLRQRDMAGGVGGWRRALGYFLSRGLYHAQRDYFLARHSRFLFLGFGAIRSWSENLGRPKEFENGPGGLLQDGILAFPAGIPGGAWQGAQEHNFRQLSFYKVAMQAVGATLGVRMFHFLQPVPLLGKELTPEETRANQIHGYRDVYLREEREFLALRRKGINAFSLTDLFAGRKESIYVDHIHLSALGNELLNRRILAIVSPYFRSLEH